jgi:N-acetyl-alpha-D-muramate 1-phosphate uridylyltransferase
MRSDSISTTKAQKLSFPEPLPVAILAGGLATRMRPITTTIPKALIEVAGKPFIHRQLEYLRGQGVSKVVLCLGFRGEQIEASVGDGSRFGVAVKYSYDGPKLLDTGGALKRALPYLSDRFFVLYGDSFLPCDFAAVQRAFMESGKPALMTVMRNEDRWDKSNVLFQDGRVLEYNKRAPRPEMAYIDYGLGVLCSDVLFSQSSRDVFDLASVYYELSLTGRLAGFEVHERFYEIGSPEGLKDAENYFAGGRP